MKKQTSLKTISKVAITAILMLIGAFSVIALVSPDMAEYLVALAGLQGGTGYSLAMATVAVSGADTREAANSARPRSATDPGHLIDDVSSLVTKIKPDDFFLDTLIRSINSNEKAKNIEIFFEEVEFRGSSDTVTVALAAPTGSTDADKYRDITVGNPSLWVAGETVYIPTQLVGGKPLQLRVEEVKSDGKLNVVAINTTDNVTPAIAQNTVIKRGATSYGELKAKGESKTLYPGIRSNYCQRFLAQVEESYIRKLVAAKSGFNFSDQNFMRMYDMRSEIEKSGIFGTKGRTWSKKENEWVHYSDGVYHQIEKELGYTGAGGITNNTWIDWTKDIFAGNSGSEDRVLMAGQDLLATILKIDSVQKQLEAGRVELVPGLKVVKVETNFGMLMLKHHKLFDSMGHNNDGVVLDMTNLKKRPFVKMNKRDLKLREAGISNVDAVLFEEISCLELRYLDTHARIRKTA